MEKENTAEDAVKLVILASAPERKDELSTLWETYKPQINLVEDNWKFSMKAGAFGSVLFDNKTMCEIWLFGFVAQKAFHIYSPFLWLAQISGLKFCPTHSIDDTCRNQYADAETVFSSVKALFDSETRELFDWPKNIPQPESGKPNDIDGIMVFELLCIAAAYCFLHELQHVALKQSSSQLSPHAEELECDRYASSLSD